MSFAALANATLLFELPTTAPSNPLGNPTVGTTPLIVVAYLRSDRSYRQQATTDGQVAAQAVVGRGIAPSLIPPEIQAEQGTATIKDSQGRETPGAVFWRSGLGLLTLPPEGFAELADYQQFLADNADAVAITGEFYWEANLPGSLGVELVLGDKIRGRFVARSSWVDSL